MQFTASFFYGKLPNHTNTYTQHKTHEITANTLGI